MTCPEYKPIGTGECWTCGQPFWQHWTIGYCVQCRAGTSLIAGSCRKCRAKGALAVIYQE